MLMLPTSKNGYFLSSAHRDEGFTLVELMVVIVIIGLMSSLVVLNLPKGGLGTEGGAEQIAARFNYAAKEAVLSGETVGVLLSRTGYRFLRYRKGAWQGFALIPKHKDHTWSEGVVVKLRLAGEWQTLPQSLKNNFVYMPFLVFTATGESVPFELFIQKDGSTTLINGDRMSHIIVGRNS